MNRFADIDVSFKRLPPIYGYRIEKLVSIEKALQPIEPEIDQLSYFIKIAKKSCCFPSKHGLSKDQSAAVYIYTMEWGDTTLYRVLNQALRSEDRKALRIWFPYLKLFDTALDKLPIVKEVIWRGVPLDIGKDFVKDQMFTWWSINSCSSSVNTIKTFLENDKKSTLFLIEAINGRKVSGYTEFETEDEVILRMGTQFRVKANALDHPNGSHVVHLIEINDDDDDDNESVTPVKKDTYSTTIPSNPDISEFEPSANVSKDVQPKEKSHLSKVTAATNEKFDDEDILQSIMDEIINVLALDDSGEKDEILKDLLENGQQSLKNYKECLIPNIYKSVMNGDNNELIELLKKYFEQQCKIKYNYSNKWFVQFINQSKCNENRHSYEQTLVRTAKYGNKIMKNCPILSITLQILFGDITSQDSNETDVFNEFWFTITTDGLKSIKKFSEYIIKNVMDEQLNKKQSILFQALRECYREKLFQLLQQCNITDRSNLYELTLDNVAEFGWKTGLKAIEDYVAPKNYKTLLEKVDSYLQQHNALRKQNVPTKPQPTTTAVAAATKPQPATTPVAAASKPGQIKSEVPLRAPEISIHPNARWQQNGLTVAGGNGQGNGNNQLSYPRGLYIDDDQTIYIADSTNHRIIEWKWNATSGQVVAGGNKPGNEAHQLSNPTDVIVDKEKDNLIICDRINRRVVRWPRRNGTSGETIISNIDCWGLTMDENGSLYVIDYEKHEVRRYRRGESQGTVVAGGNGNGNRLNQRSEYVFVDRDHSVYVSDSENNRVMKWMEGAKEGIVVAGGQGEGNSLRQLSYPRGVVVDQLDTVYVADCRNARIMRWMKGATQGNIIVGGNGEGEQSNQLNYPVGLSFDRHGNLYVVDNENRRVQKFNIDRNA